MPKLSPAFPRRRPSGYIRYAIAITVVLFLYYTFRGDSNPPYSPLDPAEPHWTAPKSPGPGAGFVDDDDVRTGLDPAEQSVGNGAIKDHDPYSSSEQPTFEEKPFPNDKATTGDEPRPEAPKEAAGPVTGSSSFATDPDPDSGTPPPQIVTENLGSETRHPIDKLVYDAQHEFAGLLAKQSNTIEEAAQAYRKRRGRHPPPGFDKWWEFATSLNAVVVEDFFDQVYHDLEPFWGMDPALIRKEAAKFEMTINVRNGKAKAESDWFWTVIWLDMIKTIQDFLPDMDIALNPMDEPRVVAPFEEVSKYMEKAAKTVNLPKPQDVVSEFQDLPSPKKIEPEVKVQHKTWFNNTQYWTLAREGCPPDSPARQAPIVTDFKLPPNISVENADAHSYKGFVSNYTKSTELCHQPDLQSLEGILIHPLSTSVTKTLFPLFGGSKLAVNNEILLPAPMYWNEEERFTGGDDHGIEWAAKDNAVVWRGVATGGKNTPNNWRGFQRHRFVAMNNATTVSLVEQNLAKPENWAMPDSQYSLQAQQKGQLSDWITEWADVSFTDLMCDEAKEDHTCPHTDAQFAITDAVTMAQQFNSKYLPDIDGNSFSGRYLGFLRSTSLPIKATLFREWHDSRLVAWKHFVPMDSRFGDYLGIMEYFLGYAGHNAHDAVAEKIATEGKEWADKVLRKEDMQIYVLRLLLEYARVQDERRETMGWVEDVLKDPSLQDIWSEWW